MSAAALPPYNYGGFFGGSPAGATVNNPLVPNPAGSNVNPLMDNPGGGTAAAPVIPGYQYNANPGTQSGNGPFGAVPGQVATPQPYQDLSSVFPNLPGANSDLSSNILTELQGGLSPGTLDAISQAQNQFGIGGPVNTSPMSLGTNDAALENFGLQQYGGTIPTVSTTQTVDPQVEAQIAQFNAEQAAAPNPTTGALVGAGTSAIASLLPLLLA